jgi:hypothetical protein
MKPELFRKLVELKLIANQTPVAVEYNVYSEQKKRGTVKGLYTINRMFADALIPGTRIEVTSDKDTAIIEPSSIKLINGLTPVALAAQHGIRPDGKTNDAPKRRGRKPKVRVAEQVFSEDDFADDEDDELDELDEAELFEEEVAA